MNSANTIKHLFICFVFFLCTSCDPFQTIMDFHTIIKLYGTNNTQHSIWFSYKDNALCNNDLSDSDDGITMDNFEEYYRRVGPDTTATVFLYQGAKWEELFPDSLQIYIFNDEVIQKVGWETVLSTPPNKKQYYEYVLILSTDDLADLDYTISYPPEGKLLDKRIIYTETND